MSAQRNSIKLSAPDAQIFWEIPVLYEDEHLLALAKPPGVHASPDRDDPKRVNLMQLLHQGIAQGKPFAAEHHLSYLANVHRLDPEVSGVFLLAKSRSVLATLASDFGSGRPYQTYVALIAGDLGQKKLTANAGIAPYPLHPGKFRVDTKKGKMARTEFTVAEKFNGFSLLHARPFTAQPHQVRVHLQSFKLPLCGDRMYGGKPLLLSQLKRRYQVKEGKSERPLTPTLPLHVEKMWFKHPVTGSPLEILAPWPKDLLVAVKYLRRYAGISF